MGNNQVPWHWLIRPKIEQWIAFHMILREYRYFHRMSRRI